MEKQLSRLIPVVAIVFLLMAGTNAARANLVVNGSFEAVQIGSPFVSNDVTNVPGWTHTGSLGMGLLWHVGYADGDGASRSPAMATSS